MKSKYQRGSTLIEFLLGFPAFLTMVAGLLTVVYYIVSHHWIRFQLQESMVCAERLNRTEECRDILVANVRRLLPVGEILESEIRLQRSQIIGRIDFRVLDDLKIEELQISPRPLVLSGES